MYPSNRDPAGFTCVTCEMPIVGQPVFHVGLPFCCAGCAADGPCGCSYDLEESDSIGPRSLGAAAAAGPTAVARRRPAVTTSEVDEFIELDEEPALASVLG